MIKQKIYEFLDPSVGGTRWDKIFNGFIVTLILLNTLAVILETIENIYINHRILFSAFEKFSVFVFTVEYILRVWSITCRKEYAHPLLGRLRYMLSSGALVDLMAIVPFYHPLITHLDLRFLRTLRLARFFRFFKLSRYLKASKVIRSVFASKREELILSFVITFFLVIIASCVMYYIEHDVQPDKFSSIPETMWWSVATLTTVGYGDVYPITTIGKTLTAFISILGIGMFALPAGILASGFAEEFRSMKKFKKSCPHCGKELS